jgi:hypothetical protein
LNQRASTAPYRRESINIQGDENPGKAIGFDGDGVLGAIAVGPALNVKSFGAKGDGTTNDAPAINAAIAAAAACPGAPADSGTIVQIPEGTFKITSPIILKNGITLRGCGNLVTVIKNYGDGDAIRAVAPEASYITIQDLQVFDGLGIASRTAGHAIHMDGTAESTGFTIERVYLLGHINGLNAKIVGYSALRDMRVASAKEIGLCVTGLNTVNLTLENVGVLNSGTVGYYLADINFCVISACFSDANASHGFHLFRGTTITFNSVSSEGNHGNAFHVDATQVLTFNSCSVAKIETDDGFVLDNARYVTIISPSIATITGVGIKGVNTYSCVSILSPRISGAVGGAYSDPLGVFSLFGADGTTFCADGAVRITPTGINSNVVITANGTGDILFNPTNIVGQNVGIGTLTPGKRLSIESGDAAYLQSIYNFAPTSSSFGLLIDAGTDASDGPLFVRSKDSVPLLRVRGDGLVTAGTESMEVSTVGKGFILKSPDGTRYLIKVANGGALSTTVA